MPQKKAKDDGSDTPTPHFARVFKRWTRRSATRDTRSSNHIGATRTGAEDPVDAAVSPRLAALDQRNWSLQYGSSSFADFVAYARYLLAIPIMIISDRSSDNRIRGLVDNFVKSGIIPADSLPIFGQMLRQADTRTASAPAEGAMLVLAFVLAAVTAYRTAELGAGQWVTGVADHSRGLSPAGWWNLLVSAPLFFFITLRWFWRFIVWTALLKRISRLPLKLVASHPDRSGGRGFLTLFPMIFWPLAFALSGVVASGLPQQLTFGGMDLNELWPVAIFWTLLVMGVFVGPLLVFAPGLSRLRERAVLEHGELVTRHNRLGEHRIREHFQACGEPDIDAITTMADIAPLIQAIYSIRLIPRGEMGRPSAGRRSRDPTAGGCSHTDSGQRDRAEAH